MLIFSSLARPKSWLQNAFREVPPLLPEPERPHFEVRSVGMGTGYGERRRKKKNWIGESGEPAART